MELSLECLPMNIIRLIFTLIMEIIQAAIDIRTGNMMYGKLPKKQAALITAWTTHSSKGIIEKLEGVNRRR